VPTQDFFDFIQRDPSLLAGIPTLARVAAYGGGCPIKVDGEVVGAIGVSGAPTVQNDMAADSALPSTVRRRRTREQPRFGKSLTGRGSGDRCVFSNVRSAILSAHYGDDVRQRAFGGLARRLH
jgi:hypothetical protein